MAVGPSISIKLEKNIQQPSCLSSTDLSVCFPMEFLEVSSAREYVSARCPAGPHLRLLLFHARWFSWSAVGGRRLVLAYVDYRNNNACLLVHALKKSWTRTHSCLWPTSKECVWHTHLLSAALNLEYYIILNIRRIIQGNCLISMLRCRRSATANLKLTSWKHFNNWLLLVNFTPRENGGSKDRIDATTTVKLNALVCFTGHYTEYVLMTYGRGIIMHHIQGSIVVFFFGCV